MTQKRTILIADDDPIVRSILGAILQSNGHTVIEVTSGQEALDEVLVRSNNSELPELMFLDIQLDDMSGFSVLQQIRESVSAEALPIAMLSANTKEEAFDGVAGPFPEHYIEKPFTPDSIQALLAAVF